MKPLKCQDCGTTKESKYVYQYIAPIEADLCKTCYKRAWKELFGRHGRPLTVLNHMSCKGHKYSAIREVLNARN